MAHCDFDDKTRYKEDNYNLSIEQRDVDNEPITPYTWKIIEFQRVSEDSSLTIATLQRPNWWSKQLGADKLGNKVYLNISEQGISGTFTVTDIKPVQLDTRFWKWEVKDGYIARPVTGKFEHKSYDVWEFEFDNGEVIGCTPTHPFYSERRQSYIPVGELEIGEPIKNKEGTIIAIKRKKQKQNGETVYNLEVYRDHNFMVGQSGLLVHNSCISNGGKFISPEINNVVNQVFSNPNKLSHLIDGSANSVHRWESLVPDKNSIDILDIVKEVLEHGTNELYNGRTLTKVAVVTRGEVTKTVQITYAMVNGKIMPSNGWVNP